MYTQFSSTKMLESFIFHPAVCKHKFCVANNNNVVATLIEELYLHSVTDGDMPDPMQDANVSCTIKA